MEYAKKVSIHKDFVIRNVSDLVQEGENQYADFFYWAIKQGFSYYAIEGLIKSEGEKSYPFLVDFIKKGDKANRGKAIIMLSKYSGQPFDYDLFDDPAYWQKIPVEKVLKWQEEGYPTCMPRTEDVPTLVENPQTEMDFIVQKLEKKLLKDRKNWRVGSWEYNRSILEVPSVEIMKEIKQKWQLPAVYLEFLQKYSPKRILLSKNISLYGAEELIKAQIGYIWDNSGKKLTDWNENWVVIADKNADPYIINLSKIKEDDCPIYKAPHGAGTWKFKKVTDSFIDFLRKLA